MVDQEPAAAPADRASVERAPLQPGPWTWRSFGNPLHLATAHSGARTVLIGGRRGVLETRDADGVLRPLRPSDPLARVMEALPELLEATRASARTFRIYESTHRAKGTPEGVMKAETNRQEAEKLEALVARCGG